jgi:SAM-dependent methyltransferase
MNEISVSRWDQAQAAEVYYWQKATGDVSELLRITYEKAEAAQWAQRTAGQIFDSDIEGTWVEVGIGPLGVGCIHFLPKSQDRTLIGVDPLPKIELSKTLIGAVEALINACHGENYRQVTCMGESIELSSDSAALVDCYNVLDHCYSPEKVLKEIWRILKPGGHLILGCDVYSWAGLMKYSTRTIIARVLGIRLESIGDVAHPHHFLAGDLENLVLNVGLKILSTNARRFEGIRRIWSHSHRMLIMARKGGSVR